MVYVWKTEQSFCVQVAITAAVLAGGWLLDFSLMEFALLAMAITLVLAAEILNTVLEKLLDIVYPTLNPAVKIIKDISAAMVLTFSLGAFIIGILLFLPRIIQ